MYYVTMLLGLKIGENIEVFVQQLLTFTIQIPRS